MIELDDLNEVNDLAATVLNGDVVVLRGGLPTLGLLEPLAQASLTGIEHGAGREAAQAVARRGFDRVHEVVEPQDIPAITDAVYATVTRLAPRFLEDLVPRVFPEKDGYYFEGSPNVRFHIPYDLAAPHRRQYDQFARKHGQGKIAPHGPHRDSWLDCADNAINLWIAVGPVRRGNGLSVFADRHDDHFSFDSSGEIRDKYRLGRPLNFDMEPGDVLLFHSDQLHASELNRTTATRYVVSFRITFDKPHFPNGHYHHYRHGALATSAWPWVAGVPANLQWSYVAFRLRWLAKRLRVLNDASPRRAALDDAEDNGRLAVAGTDGLPLSTIPVGAIRAMDEATCLVRPDVDHVVAVSRRCPHRGADLAHGFVADGTLVCPWHNLPFDLGTGRSPCAVIAPLRRAACDTAGDRVQVPALGPALRAGAVADRS